jgi:protein SCO1
LKKTTAFFFLRTRTGEHSEKPVVPCSSEFFNMPRPSLTLITLFILLAGTLRAQDLRYGIEEKTGDRIPDAVLLSSDSVTVNLHDLINKPTLLSFVYFRCPGLCSPVMNGIAELIRKSDLQIGKDYQVITIDIDYKEPVVLARAKKQSYLNTLHVKGVGEGWNFFHADSATVKLLTDAAGWEFKRTGNDFIHGAATMLLTPGGNISDYFYGTFILPMEFHLAVDNAAKGLLNTARPKDQKYCYNFTPIKNFPYRLVMSVSGIGLLLAVVFLFIWLSLKRVRNQQTGS